jgi:hypothetical protein
MYDEDITVAWRAAWGCEKIGKLHPMLLSDKTTDLIRLAMQKEHGGMRRLLLSMLLRLPMPEPFPVDLLDFCYERISREDETVAVQSLCIKIAYKLCATTPELLPELQIMLAEMNGRHLSAGIRSALRNTMKKIYDIR